MKTTANLTNPILILKQIPGSNTPGEPTPCGYETIRIWHFNVDGEGGALVTYDAETEFDLCFGEDLQYILCGHPVSGHRRYRPINLKAFALWESNHHDMIRSAMHTLEKVNRRFALRIFSALSACLLIGCDGSKPSAGGTSATPLPPPAPGCVRVVNWNLEWFPGRSPSPTPRAKTEQLEAVKTAMVGLAPDILLTQEVKSEAALTQVLPPSYRVATTSRFSGAQQLCIAGRLPSESAWFEPWKKDGKDDPPRGFAYASFRLASGRLLMVYTVHLKSNAGGDAASNRAKREDAARQLIGHIAAVLPQQREKMVPAVLIGGDFNTDPDRPQFAGELTVKMFLEAGFEWVLGTLPQSERITWPAADGYPDAVFDHVLTKGIKVRAVMVPKGYEGCSDHRPVVVDVEG